MTPNQERRTVGKERPILFSAPMVRAILAGRKTQTRRLVKFQPTCGCKIRVGRYSPAVVDRHGEEVPGPEVFGAYCDEGCWGMRCRHGAPGDRLWVKETSAIACFEKGGEFSQRLVYRADFPDDYDGFGLGPLKPSMFMKRGESRIALEITDVRVERLQEITGEDARAEGIEVPRCDCEPCRMTSHICTADAGSYVEAFRDLWDRINGERATWTSNPWVWVVGFKRLEAP